MGMRIRNVRTVGHRPYIYIYIVWLLIEHPREWLASLADYPAHLRARVIGERSERDTLRSVQSRIVYILYTRKMVPITGRVSSFFEFLFVCMYVNRKEEEEGETEQQLQSYQFTQGYI